MIKADRTSRYLSVYSLANLMRGVEAAALIDHPLNTFVSINCSSRFAEVEDIALDFAGKLTKLASDYMYKEKTQFCSVWVFENPSSGLNWHWLLHVPPHLHKQFMKRLRRWYSLAGGKRHARSRKTVILSNPEELAYRARYFAKGSHPHLAMSLGVRPRDQGTITGKRCSVSEAINHKAQRALFSKFDGTFRYNNRTICRTFRPFIMGDSEFWLVTSSEQRLRQLRKQYPHDNHSLPL